MYAYLDMPYFDIDAQYKVKLCYFHLINDTYALKKIIIKGIYLYESIHKQSKWTRLFITDVATINDTKTKLIIISN